MIELNPLCNHLQVKKEDLQVCLIYPGEPFSGFSSLAISNIYSNLNAIEGVSCDIGFGTQKLSFFLEKPFTEFDILAFSITYEEHLFEVIKTLIDWNIEPERDKRNLPSPLIFAGGIGVFYNPAPFLPIFDVIYLGEAEERMEKMFKNLAGKKNKQKLLEIMSEFDNIIISENYRFQYEKDRISGFSGDVKKIFRSSEYSRRLSCSCFITEETAFKGMALVELSRGCPEKCRFCVAQAMGLPYREKEIDLIEKEIEAASKITDRVGLIGTAVTDYSKMEQLYNLLRKYNMKASFSSLRVSSTSNYVLKIVKESGQKTVTIAPEAGKEEKRMALNKKVTDAQFFDFCYKLFENGAENLKLYFLIGIPEETDEDIEAIVSMTLKFKEIAMHFWKERKKTGKITLSVNPLIPKPFTPMQWFGMPSKSLIDKRIKLLGKLIRKIPNVELTFENTRNAIIQAVISRGDDRIGIAAINTVKNKTNFKRSLKELGLKLEPLYTREREKEELFPWEIVNSGIKRDYLWQEYMKIFEGKPSPACFKGCKACGLCE
ncbi:radical SAM protein [Desulfurobacterium sp.]